MTTGEGRTDELPGTLDLMVLKLAVMGPQRGIAAVMARGLRRSANR